jgi:hypothetical protein
MKELAVWLASHANPRHERSSLVNPKPPVHPEGVASLPTDLTAAVNAHQELDRSLENRERSAQ